MVSLIGYHDDLPDSEEEKRKRKMSVRWMVKLRHFFGVITEDRLVS